MEIKKKSIIKAALVAFVITSLISVYKINTANKEQENLTKLVEINKQLAKKNAEVLKLNSLENVLLNGDASTVIPEILAFAQEGSTRAQYDLGWAYREGLGVDQSYQKSLEWFLKAAAAENIDRDGDAQTATYYIGELYLKGLGTIEKDEVKAKEWLMKAQGYGIKEASVLLSQL